MPKSLKRIALIVSIGTFSSKIGGLVRQLVIAGAFGVGSTYEAYNYAYIIPGFFLILLGGINGPFHNGVVTVLSNKGEKERQYLLSGVNTLIGSFLLLITLLLIFFADPIIHLLGPGLPLEIHDNAVLQLKIMAPIAFLSGLIGLGFGSLNTKNEFLLPSLSPLFSSLIVIIFVGTFWLTKDSNAQSIEIAITGGIVISLATLIGALLQWITQIPSLIKSRYSKLRLNWDWSHPGIKELITIIAPATLSAGMLQINVFTDLVFASLLDTNFINSVEIKGVASGLTYASFLIQAPLGIISSALIIPLLPTLSKLSKANSKPEFSRRVEQGLVISIASMTVLGGIFIAIGGPIVELVYQRGSFQSEATKLVSGLLIAYGVGMPFYLARDFLVRVFYSLGDGKTPFKISILGILMNILFDWILIGNPGALEGNKIIDLGPHGLVIATVLVNLITCIFLLLILKSKSISLNFKSLKMKTLKILFSGSLAGYSAWSISNLINWPSGFIPLSIEILISSILSLALFNLICSFIGLEEIRLINNIFKKNVLHE